MWKWAWTCEIDMNLMVQLWLEVAIEGVMRFSGLFTVDRPQYYRGDSWKIPNCVWLEDCNQMWRNCRGGWEQEMLELFPCLCCGWNVCVYGCARAYRQTHFSTCRRTCLSLCEYFNIFKLYVPLNTLLCRNVVYKFWCFPPTLYR